MPRRNPKPLLIVHDHFDGSAHCVECGGECQLAGHELFTTQLIRSLCESSLYQNRPLSMSLEMTIIDTIGHDRYCELRGRCVRANPKRDRPIS
jgi:hypothetical protein